MPVPEKIYLLFEWQTIHSKLDEKLRNHLVKIRLNFCESHETNQFAVNTQQPAINGKGLSGVELCAMLLNLYWKVIWIAQFQTF